MASVPNGSDPEPKITRKGQQQQSGTRQIGKYLDRETTAPQPAGPKSIHHEIEREANKRRNPSR